MSNQELDDVASKLGITKTTTSAYSPHQNGVNGMMQSYKVRSFGLTTIMTILTKQMIQVKGIRI